MKSSVSKKELSRRGEDIRRIGEALEAAAALLRAGDCKALGISQKTNGDPVTLTERLVDHLLRRLLLRNGEGWLSEETPDDLDRLAKRRVWIVDPLDGTREFLAGIPEWCVSVALAEEGRAVAGGICNPVTQEFFLGSPETGLQLNGKRAPVQRRRELEGVVVLASRSEVSRGEWERFRNASFVVRPMGSIAYKLAHVAAGLADATWTMTPKSEWDVAAGVALVMSARGEVKTWGGVPPRFNRPVPRFDGLVAFRTGGCTVRKLLSKQLYDGTEGATQATERVG